MAPRSRPGTTCAALAFAAVLVGCGGSGATPPDGGDATGDGVIHDAVDNDGTETGGGTAIVVNTPSGTTASESRDGYCDILEAVAAATSGTSVGECANRNGLTRIVLEPGNSYPVRKTLRLPPAAEIGIADGKTGSATITAAPGFAVTGGDPSSACLVFVSDTKANVSLRDLTLTQDPGLTLSGACITKGMLTIRRAHVTGFRAGGIVATCLSASGCDHETDIDQSTTLTVLASLVDGNHNAGKGGGIASEGSGATVYVRHSAVVDNVSDDAGGGIYLGGGWNNDIIASSTISGNTTSGVGGGLFVKFVETTNTYVYIQTSTIANNTASGTGGGIEFEPPPFVIGNGTHDVNMFSSIVAGNFSISTLEWNINAAWTDPNATVNCITGSFIYVTPGNPRPTDMGGCTFDERNPVLGPLMPMGGVGNLPVHPLLAGSPAVDGAEGDSARDQQRDPWIADVDPGTPDPWTVFDPLVDGDGDGAPVRDLGAIERNDRWQTELLAVRAQGVSAHTVVTTPSGYDRGAGTAYAAAGATNEFVTYALPVGEAGRYDMTVGVRRDADAGKFQVLIADAAAGPWTALGTEQDGYAAASAFASLGPFATAFASPGEKLVRVSVTGKNPASSGYGTYLDFVELKRSTAACAITGVAAGSDHTCVLMSGGGVRCWGANASGQLGDGGGADRSGPPAVDVASDVAAVATGANHTCVLSTGGAVRCWGGNTSGQLGDGTTTPRATPPTDPVLSGVKAISAGRGYTCALTTAGGVRCWGANESGQLGDGTTTGRPRPPTMDVLSGVKAITAGGGHTCALMDAGGVRCWGANGVGQLGDGTTDGRSSPPTSDVVGGVAAVSAGDNHTCTLTDAGGVRCWGHNADGELGIGMYDPVLSPPNADVLTGVQQIVASALFTCALRTGGGVRCWGYNSHGQIGDDTPLAVDRLSPAAADILQGAASLAGGFTHVCARMTSGGVRCWGGNDSGQLGDGMPPIFALTPPTRDTAGFTGTCQ